MNKSNVIVAVCLIMKNESKTIERCIKQLVEVFPIICILDTGSTDDSIEIARRVLTESGVRFAIGEDTWIDDFSYSRNKAINMGIVELHKHLGIYNEKMVLNEKELNIIRRNKLYLYVKDVDDILSNTKQLKKEIEKFTHNVYYMNYVQGSSHNKFLSFIKYIPTYNIVYKGAIHETLDNISSTSLT